MSRIILTGMADEDANAFAEWLQLNGINYFNSAQWALGEYDCISKSTLGDDIELTFEGSERDE